MSIEITPALLADRRQKAEAAGGGYWQIDLTCVVYEQRNGRADTFVVSCEDASAADLTHIAAASPAVMLALVAEVERLRNRLEELECPNCGNQPKFCMCEVEQPEASNADQA
jgi:hypothetical protein